MSETRTPNHRFRHLDLLRGIAILAILLPNLYSFGLPVAEFVQPGIWLEFSGASVWLWALIALWVEWKFHSLFALLFGAGIWLFAQRLRERYENPRRMHYRRCRWLLLFGLIHAYVLWDGDILFTLALCAMVVWPFRRFSLQAQMLVSLLMFGLCSAFYWLLFTAVPTGVDMFSQEEVLAEVEAMRGGWLSQLPVRALAAFYAQVEVLLFGWRIAGLMLLGMVLMRMGVAISSQRLFGPAVVALLLGGGVLTGVGIVGSARSGFSAEFFLQHYFQYHYWGSLLMALGYAGAVLRWSQTRTLPGLRRRLEAVGRTAFSCYIAQSVLCTSLFYGHGLGLFGTLDRLQLAAVAVAIWVFLLWLAPWWMQRFNFGPLEWLWRGLTYRRWPPFRRHV